ncbi:class I SAM-dependent methyltransferase [Micromonospora aurantiaca (nom. illeg.)]|uniref:class I SAM-dependent methyltransferase n=1 Tax=Micromonospora aurantiaca (nom. illeg.) TaxID=47850 RepID=UPI00340BD9DF
MGADRTRSAALDFLTDEQQHRWTTVLEHLISALPYEGRLVLVDGFDHQAGLLANRLADRLRELGRPCVRLAAGDCVGGEENSWPGLAAGAIVIADGPRWRDRLPAEHWHLNIWVRTAPHGNGYSGDYRGDQAHAVIDLHDPTWPVIRHLDPFLVPGDYWYHTESRAFFACRAATWDTKFGADLPAYATAIAEARLLRDGTAVDLGCGTGRALPALRDAVGPDGTVIGIDHTPQMLAQAQTRADAANAILLLADARHLPLATGSVDAVFAAGLLNHLPSAPTGLQELARITRPGGRLVLFHPSGHAALAARHGRTLNPREPLAEPVLRATTTDAGWGLISYEDSARRFHALAVRH